MDFGCVSGKTLRFVNGHHRGRPGSGGYRYGFQFKCCVRLGKIQRLLLFSQTPGCLVPSGNRGSARGQKHGLPQIAPAYLPHHAGDFSAFAGCYVSGSQQGGRWSTKMADSVGVFFSTLGAGKVYSRSFYRQVSGQKSRQTEGLRLRLPSQPGRPGFLFRSDFISTRFWHRHNYLHGHLHNAFCRRSLFLSVLALIPFIASAILGAEYRTRRIIAFLDPWQDPSNAGFQAIQSFYAFGRGGYWGTGLGASHQKLFYLPEAHTDFIFSVIGEELGLLGTTAIILLFSILIWRGFVTACRAKDPFGTHLATGLTLLIGFQAFINLGVTVGLLPTKGLTLPFISMGGSSMLITMLSVGVLLNISEQTVRHR